MCSCATVFAYCHGAVSLSERSIAAIVCACVTVSPPAVECQCVRWRLRLQRQSRTPHSTARCGVDRTSRARVQRQRRREASAICNAFRYIGTSVWQWKSLAPLASRPRGPDHGTGVARAERGDPPPAPRAGGVAARPGGARRPRARRRGSSVVVAVATGDARRPGRRRPRVQRAAVGLERA